jgi:hypothetical protein
LRDEGRWGDPLAFLFGRLQFAQRATPCGIATREQIKRS